MAVVQSREAGEEAPAAGLSAGRPDLIGGSPAGGGRKFAKLHCLGLLLQVMQFLRMIQYQDQGIFLPEQELLEGQGDRIHLKRNSAGGTAPKNPTRSQSEKLRDALH